MHAHILQNPKVTADRMFNGFGTNFVDSPEPIYGNLFLPRKFKVAVTGEEGGACARGCWCGDTLEIGPAAVHTA
jgi:hypothetical protein